ncbi:hypothetical protein [Cedecea sp. NFIX57]|uniref:hypothetical protein n=1 Tax=Cedecea sp. NFIX57 TaxID=1566286 RepID=UPI000A0A87C5|nr:hypothetical protein [Cedecea sp. NFIX57]SMG60184.1 hypothetical protein SAMN03159353_103427 [Cedecea sp. NFIX57]
MTKQLEALMRRLKVYAEEFSSTVLSADDCIALIAALELAEKQRDSWKRIAQTNLSEREKDIAELDAARKRIAELEASPLAVKLPNRLQPGADGPDDWYLHSDPDGEYMKADDVIEAIRAAGGTVDEGE